MNNKTLYLLGGIVVVASLAFGFIGGRVGSNQSLLGGDFAGGQLPSQLVTGNAAGGYVNPVGSLAFASPNGVYVGGTSQYNELLGYDTASGTTAAAGNTLGALGLTTSTATSSVLVTNTAGLSIGAICSGGVATTTMYVAGCTLATTNGATGTATVAYGNITGAAITVPSTTVLRITFDQLPY